LGVTRFDTERSLALPEGELVRPVAADNACASAAIIVLALRPLGIGGVPPQAMRARCGGIRDCLTLLGVVTAAMYRPTP